MGEVAIGYTFFRTYMLVKAANGVSNFGHICREELDLKDIECFFDEHEMQQLILLTLKMGKWENVSTY